MTATTHCAKLIETVESDINVLGWDKPARIFVLKGEEGDEYLELFTELDMNPIDFLEQATYRLGPIPADDNRGIAVVSEGYTYSKEVSAQLGTKTPDEQREFYEMLPPSQHPDRREVRSVVMVQRNGEVQSVNRLRGVNGEDDEVFGAGGNMDGRLVDTMRMALGLNEDFNAAWAKHNEATTRAAKLTLEFMAGGLGLGENPSLEAKKSYIRQFCKEKGLPSELAEAMIALTVRED